MADEPDNSENKKIADLSQAELGVSKQQLDKINAQNEALGAVIMELAAAQAQAEEIEARQVDREKFYRRRDFIFKAIVYQFQRVVAKRAALAAEERADTDLSQQVLQADSAVAVQNNTSILATLTELMQKDIQRLTEFMTGASLSDEENRREMLAALEKSSELKAKDDDKEPGIKASGGLGILGKLGKGLGEGIGQLFKGIGKGLRFLGKNFGSIMKGIITIGALGLALVPASKAFQEFSEVSWSGVGMGLTALGGLAIVAALLSKASGSMIIGALAIGALGLALIPAAKAFQMFGDVSWKSVGVGLTVLAGLAATAALLSAASVPMLIGAAAIALLGAAMIPAAKAFQMFAAALEPVAEFINDVLGGMAVLFNSVTESIGGLISSIATEIKGLAALDGDSLLSTAAGITAVGAALAAFGTGGTIGKIIGSIGDGIAKLFGAKSPIEQLKEVANLGPNLEKAANAIQALPAALNKVGKDLNSDFKTDFENAAETIGSLGSKVSSLKRKFNFGLTFQKVGLQVSGLLDTIDKGLDKLSSNKLSKVTDLVVNRVIEDTSSMAPANLINNGAQMSAMEKMNADMAAAGSMTGVVVNNITNNNTTTANQTTFHQGEMLDENVATKYG